jgi:hypothetical protein
MNDQELAMFYRRALREVQFLSGVSVGHPGSLLVAINKYVTDILAESTEDVVAKVVADLEALDSAQGWAETLIESLQVLVRTKTEATQLQQCDNTAPCGDPPT